MIKIRNKEKRKRQTIKQIKANKSEEYEKVKQYVFT